MTPTRRGLLTGLGSVILVAPAIVRASSIMAIKPLKFTVETFSYELPPVVEIPELFPLVDGCESFISDHQNTKGNLGVAINLARQRYLDRFGNFVRFVKGPVTPEQFARTRKSIEAYDAYMHSTNHAELVDYYRKHAPPYVDADSPERGFGGFRVLNVLG